MSSFKRIVAAGAAALALPVAAEITLFEHDGFDGRGMRARGAINDLEYQGFNDQVSSAIVNRGAYEVCEHAHFGGHCVILGPGEYPSFNRLGFNDRVSSIRPVAPDRYGDRYYDPPPLAYDYRARRYY
jgi:hypothetical protein